MTNKEHKSLIRTQVLEGFVSVHAVIAVCGPDRWDDVDLVEE